MASNSSVLSAGVSIWLSLTAPFTVPGDPVNGDTQAAKELASYRGTRPGGLHRWSGRNAPQLAAGAEGRSGGAAMSSPVDLGGAHWGGEAPAQSFRGFSGTSHQRGPEACQEGGMRKALHLQNERRHPLFHPHGVQLWGRQAWVSRAASPRPRPPPCRPPPTTPGHEGPHTHTPPGSPAPQSPPRASSRPPCQPLAPRRHHRHPDTEANQQHGRPERRLPPRHPLLAGRTSRNPEVGGVVPRCGRGQP